MKEKLLFRFRHGLGDAVMFTIVLKHLKFYYPEVFVGVESPVGLHSVFEGLADETFPMRKPFYWRDDYPEPIDIQFLATDRDFVDLPCTKTTNCLLDEFCEIEDNNGVVEIVAGMEPREELYSYQITPNQEVKNKVNRFIAEEINNEPFAVLHCRGTATAIDKDLSDSQAGLLMDKLKKAGYRVVLLDWDFRIPIDGSILRPDRRHPYLWNGERVGDGATICELINRAKLFLGIDSGPGHVAAATKTPSIIFWVNHHPADCFDYHNNVLHYAPEGLKCGCYYEAKYPESFRWYAGGIEDCVTRFHREADLAGLLAEIQNQMP